MLNFISILQFYKDQRVTTTLRAFTLAQIMNYFIEAVSVGLEKNKFYALRVFVSNVLRRTRRARLEDRTEK